MGKYIELQEIRFKPALNLFSANKRGVASFLSSWTVLVSIEIDIARGGCFPVMKRGDCVRVDAGRDEKQVQGVHI
jgi:hypothetical protein